MIPNDVVEQRPPRLKPSRRGTTALLVVLAATAAWATYTKLNDSLLAGVKADYDFRMSYCRVTDIQTFAELFLDEQKLFLQIAPPDDKPFVQPFFVDPVPFDWQNFPKEFRDGLAGEIVHGTPVYFVHVAEDPDSGDLLFYNSVGKPIYAIPAPKDYNPYWFAESRFPGVLNGRYTINETEWVLKAYDPARIQMTFRLLPSEHLYEYLLAEAEAAAALAETTQESFGDEGAAMMLLDEGDFAITAYPLVTNDMRVTWPSDTNGYYKIQQSTDLLAQVWSTTNMVLGVAGDQFWPVPTTNDLSEYAFFRVVQCDVADPGDEDADGMDDVWELAYGLNPLNPGDAGQDGDSDGLTNFQEYQNDTVPNNADSNGNGVPDGWDPYGGAIIKGDVNGDGILSTADLTALDAILASSAFNISPVTFAQADLNGDGVLDQIDRQALQDLLDGKPQLFMFKPKAN